MSKSINEGYKRFVTSGVLEKLMESHMPDLERMWSAIPNGYRVMLYRQAGIDQGRVAEGLQALSQDERKRLQAANLRISELQTSAARVLAGALISRKSGLFGG